MKKIKRPLHLRKLAMHYPNTIMLYAAMSLTILLFLCGCGHEVPQSENTIENTYYFYNDGNILMKYNLITESLSTVCSDPVCKHENDCFFSGAHYVTAHENKIFFSRTDISSISEENGIYYITESICSFDYANKKSEVLCKIKSDRDSSLQGMIEYYDGYIYFYRQTPNPEEVEFSLYRVSENGGSVEDMKLSVPMWHSLHLGGRLYFFDNVDTLYSTDIYGENKITEAVLSKPGRILIPRFSDDGLVYYWTICSDGTSEIGRKNPKSEDNELLLSLPNQNYTGEISNMYQSKEKLYFLLSRAETEYGTTDIGRTLSDSYGGKIYALSLNDKKVEVVYDDADMHFLYLRKCGERIVAFAHKVTDDNISTVRFVVN